MESIIVVQGELSQDWTIEDGPFGGHENETVYLFAIMFIETNWKQRKRKI